MARLYISNFRLFSIKYFLILSLSGFFIDFIFTNIIINNNYSLGASKVLKILNEKNQNQIPIFGSSRAQAHFVPSIINDDAYNYGLSGEGLTANYFLIAEELRKNKKSMIIINYDINGGLLKNKLDISRLIPTYKKTYNFSNENSFIYYIPFIRYYGRFLEYVKLYINFKMNLVSVFDNGGKFENRITPISYFNKLIEKRTNSSRLQGVNHDEEETNKLLNLLKSTNRKVAIIIGPYHKSFLNNCDFCQELIEEDSFLRNANSFSNVTILDYKELFLEHSNDYFFDTTHLNYIGAKKFSKLVKSELGL